MSTAFAKLKKNRKTQSKAIINKLTNEANGDKAKYQDDRQYYPERDSTGNGYAVIRFLEPLVGKPPFVKVYNHGFKDVGGWLIENCPTSIDKPCPICAANSDAWQSGDKQLARDRKRKKSYYSNILVVTDPKNPDNEGKVFIFRYGQKIFDKIMGAVEPEFDDEEPIDPYDLWEGANFKLKIRKVEGQVNYDSCEFAETSPIADTDEAIEEIWNRQYDLTEFLDPKNFKSEKELADRLARVTGRSATNQTAEDLPSESAEPASSEAKHKSGTEEASPELDEDDADLPSADDDEEDSDMALFRSFGADDD